MTALRFLIDENLSVKMPDVAHRRGFEAAHVAHLGLGQWKDWNILEIIRQQHWILVTNNATQINVSTKSGGNRYHGALFEFLRNDVLDAKPYAFTNKPPNKSPFKWNQYGFELDGPVRIPKLFNGKDRLFFMANYESFRQRLNSQSLFSVPTSAMFGIPFLATRSSEF